MTLELDVADDADQAARRAAESLFAAVTRRGAIGAVCLAGGETPRRMYEHLTEEPFKSKFPWQKVDWFIGDERFVPPGDPRSNFRMIKETLVSRAPIPEARVHAYVTEGVEPERAAELYENRLMAFYGSETLSLDKPLFDFVALGLGTDGHTASLFPGLPEVDEKERWALAVLEGAPERRLTLTPPALRSARTVAFLAVGESKREALAKLRAGDRSIPAARIGSLGALRAFVDRAAAG